MKNKISCEQVMEWEADALIDALLDGSLELNDAFLDRYCSDSVKAALKPIPELDRAFYLEGNIEKHWFNGTVPSRSDGILLPCDEIEFQFDGNPADVFEDVDEYKIRGNLAYLYVGYGLSIEVDTDAIEQAFAEYTQVAE